MKYIETGAGLIVLAIAGWLMVGTVLHHQWFLAAVSAALFVLWAAALTYGALKDRGSRLDA